MKTIMKIRSLGTDANGNLPPGESIAAAVAKRRMASKRRRAFTLVEVIVVLVILAVLAAIAIPALTGYIDKSEWTEKKLQIKTQITALQTMMIENPESSFRIHGYGAVQPTDYFRNVSKIASTGEYAISDMSAFGIQEFERLTGSAPGADFGIDRKTPSMRVDSSGAILYYYYRDYVYFDFSTTKKWLGVLYLQDNETSRSTINYFKTTYGVTLDFGYNVVRIDETPPATCERLA